MKDMKNKKPYYIIWEHSFSKYSKMTPLAIWTFKQRYKTKKAQLESMKNIESKGHKIIESN